MNPKCLKVTLIVINSALRYFKSFYYLGRRRAYTNRVCNKLAKLVVIEEHRDTMEMIDIAR